MGKVSNKKKSNNTNSTQKLSDIVPELAYFDKVKKQVSFSSLLIKAQVAVRYSKEKNLSKDTKSKIKSLFSVEHFVAVTYMRDFLLGLPDLSRDERNHRQKKLTEFYDKVKDLLFESLDDNVSNLDKFNELEREKGIIWGGVAFDAGTYQGRGTIDKETRVVKFPEPAKTRQIIYSHSQSIQELIAKGESHTLEFKETLEWSVKKNEYAPYLKKECLRAIAAFLNTDGGTLLIGVSDAGEVKGIARDLKFVKDNNCDGFEQKLRSLINDHFDPSPLGNVEIAFEELQEGTVCQIKARQSSKPIAYDNDFYIRDGNGTRKLEGRDLADWIQQRAN